MRKTVVEGVRLNEYNATYEEGIFDITLRGELYEIREVNSGTTFYIEKGVFDDEGRSQEGAKAIKGNVEGHTGGRGRNKPFDDRGYQNDHEFRRITHRESEKQDRGSLNKDRGIQRKTYEPSLKEP